MAKLFSVGFWETIARLILRNKIGILISIAAATIFFGLQWDKMRFTYTEANLLPDQHEVNLKYNDFLKIFGEEGNLIVLGVKDSSLFTIEKLNAWNKLSNDFKAFNEVETVIAISDLQKLVKNEAKKKFDLEPFIKDSITSLAQLETLQEQLFEQYPFYDNFLFNKETKTIRSAIYLDKEIVNTSARKDFVINKLIPKIEAFEKNYNLDVRISGMPYIRTLNSQNIIDEISTFILAALGVTSLIFFFFFRSFRATFISMVIVVIGVMWTFGIIGILEYEITVLTALIPPLIIVIGIPNCIFLINKYQQEVKKHGNKAKSLQRVITKVGNATLMTNVTTASGFATFIITDSKLLTEFGIVASLSILAIFILCLLIIPIIYSYMPKPKERHLEHLSKRWINAFVDWMEHMVRYKKINIYAISLILLIVSIIGIYQIKISGSLIEDMPQKSDFFKDIRFFEEEFNGIMPLEIMVNTKRKKGVMKLATLKRMNELEELIIEIPELSRPISVVSLVKYSKQAYYNGNPKYYQLPTSQENSFILSYVKNSSSNVDLLKNFVDSTGQYARITTFMKDINTENWRNIIGVIPQDITIFNGNVIDNILLGKEDKPENIVAFCKEYGLEKFIAELPQGYATILGEEGINLSGGQKQLLALMRVLYKKPKLLLLDEFTSAMDRKTEQFVINLLNKLKSKMSIIFISHRLHTLKRIADRIYIIENGETKVFGTHKHLMQFSNFYSDYWLELSA